jgi:uncharacterized Zn-finger protein
MGKVKCAYCNKAFEKSLSEIKRSTKRDNHFCCRKHYDIWRGVKEQKTYVCAQCGEEFKKSASLYDKRDNHFCGQQCYNDWRSEHLKGENNYNPKAKESKNMQCDYCNKKYRLPQYRLKIIKEHNFCCWDCKLAWHKENSRVVAECNNCKKELDRELNQVKNNILNFCNQNCRKEYHKKHPSEKESLRQAIRTSVEYREWRIKILERDGYLCQECGAIECLDTHHLKEFSKILKDHGIMDLESALLCAELWDENNGMTLCIHCHADRHPDFRNLILKRIA